METGYVLALLVFVVPIIIRLAMWFVGWVDRRQSKGAPPSGTERRTSIQSRL